MTQPTQPRQPSNGQIAALAALLASTLPLATIVTGLASVTGLGNAIAGRLIEQAPSSRLIFPGAGPAARQVAVAESTYRAAYLLNAAARVKASIAAGKTAEEALAAEQSYTLAHERAAANRARSAAEVDKTMNRVGSSVLGWRARMDSRTSAECRAANGHNFEVFAVPLIGWPGAVHPHCRCRPVAPFAGAPMLPSAAPVHVARQVAVG